MKIKYSPTRTVTTADLFIAADPPIVFEVKARLSPGWAQLLRVWEDNGSDDEGMACELMGQAFMSVSQDDERYPLNSKEAAEQLSQAIEVENEGAGGPFICEVVQAFAFNHFNFLARSSAGLDKLSGQSNGTGKKKSRIKQS